MNPYHPFVAEFARLVREGKSLPLGGIESHGKPQAAFNAPVGLLFSPHPDDECIIGGLALRLLREARLKIVNVAVTQGSNKERQEPRLKELKNACGWLGFDLEQTAPRGLEKITPQTRKTDPAHWAKAVDIIAASLSSHQPRIVFLPHELDWNGTHIGTHFLVMDALARQATSFSTVMVETEFWGQMYSPNLMVELAAEEVADLLAALSFHVGEVQRNPYHLRMPAWLQDNVRRGAELVGGQGGAAPNFMFATLYRVQLWKQGRTEPLYTGGRQLTANDSAAAVLSWAH